MRRILDWPLAMENDAKPERLTIDGNEQSTTSGPRVQSEYHWLQHASIQGGSWPTAIRSLGADVRVSLSKQLDPVPLLNCITARALFQTSQRINVNSRNVWMLTTLDHREAWRYTGQFSRWNRFKGAFPGLGTATVAFAGYCAYEHFFMEDEHHHGEEHGEAHH